MRQRTASAEEALEVLCGAIDPCLIIQPVASLAQFGNARLKVCDEFSAISTQ